MRDEQSAGRILRNNGRVTGRYEDFVTGFVRAQPADGERRGAR